MQKDGQKNQPSHPIGNHEAGANRHAVKQGMDAQPHHDRVAGMPRDEFTVVGFLSEMEVGVDGVFKQMDDAVPGHDENRSKPRTETQAFRGHFEEGGRHEKSGTQGDEVAQIAFNAACADQYQSAGHVRQGGNGAENQGDFQHLSLSAMSDVHDVSVLHDVFLALKAQYSLGAGDSLGARS